MSEPITTTAATVIMPSPLQILGTVFTIVIGWKVSIAVIDVAMDATSKAIDAARKEVKEQLAVHNLKKHKKEEISVTEVSSTEKIIPANGGSSKTLAEKLSFWKKSESLADTVTAEDLAEAAVATS